MRLVLTLLLLLACPRAAQAQMPQWSDPDLGRAIREGVATTDHLWLLGASGAVVRFDRASGDRTVVATGLTDILADGPRLWALAEENPYQISVKDLRSPDQAPLNLNLGGKPVGLFMHNGDLGLLTSEMAVIRAGDRWDRHRLAATVSEGGWLLGDGDRYLYLGFNRGEWGGGLRRIDLDTGSISFVAERADDLCGGLLNPECAPIVGLAPDLAHGECVIVGSGLAHLTSRRGVAVRVCPETIDPLFSASIPATKSTFGMPGQTWTFYSLVPTPDGWLAVSDERYFRARGDEVREHPLPALHDWSGLKVSSPEDGVIFIMGACCWGSDTWILSSTLALPIAE